MDVVRFAVWKAGLWPVMDCSSVEAELALLVLACRFAAHAAGPASGCFDKGRTAQAAAGAGGGPGAVQLGGEGGDGTEDGGGWTVSGVRRGLESFIALGIAHTSRPPADLCPSQKLLWLLAAAYDGAAGGGDGGCGGGGGAGAGWAASGPGSRKDAAAGIVQEMLVSWHARQWNASFLHIAEICRARVLPFDPKPARRRGKDSDADSRAARGLDAGLGPAAMCLPLKSFNAVLLQERWVHVTVANRGQALSQMKALALHLAGLVTAPGEPQSAAGEPAVGAAAEGARLLAWPSTRDEEVAGGEWRLLWELLAQIVTCYAERWPQEVWCRLRRGLATVRRRLSGKSGDCGPGSELDEVKGWLLSVDDDRAQSLFRSCLLPALDLFKPAARGEVKEDSEAAYMAGQAWGLLGTCRLHLLAADSPVDPAAKVAVKLRFAEARIRDAQLELHVLRAAADLGGAGFYEREQALKAEVKRLEERRRKLAGKVVLRPAAPSFEALHRELHHFCSTVGEPGKVLRMLRVGCGPSESGSGGGRLLQEEEQWQQVADMFCARLERDFEGYRDVTVPHVLAVLEMRRGLRLVAFHGPRREQGAGPGALAATMRGLLRFPVDYDVRDSDMVEQVPRFSRLSHQSSSSFLFPLSFCHAGLPENARCCVVMCAAVRGSCAYTATAAAL